MVFAQRFALDTFEERVLRESRQKSIVAADGVLNGLNMLMINGIISNAEQRALYIKKMGDSDKVLELRNIRNKPIQDQFGVGLPSEQAVDEMDKLALTTSQEQSKLQDQNGVVSLRIVKPFIAKRDFRGTNCLECHTVPEGTVLGAVSVTLDISDEFNVIHKANLALWGIQLVIQIFLYFAIGWLIGFVTRPLEDAVEVANAVAKGDLTRQIEVKSSDEVGQLLKSLKGMNESLTGIVIEVRSTTDSIITSSHEIAQGNADLSQRTEEQASSLEETASSMQELTSTVRQNAENARQANQLAANASSIAVKGGQVVGDVVHTMASISDSSKKIVDIISVIDGIAFQTNILALNAAVEAARAGEQGRGFAVVAGEVRNLAQRSAAAAKEIKALIDDSVNKVDAGTKQVDQAGATMTEIVQAVKRVTDIMAEIAAASNEQSAGIEQVNQAIVQMDEMTQQNAALVEEAAAAAEAMEEQGNDLYEAVGIFRVAGGREDAERFEAKVAAMRASKSAVLQGVTRAKPAKGRQLSKSEKDTDEWKEF
jgi:methyl-accepting chemotaxis protein